MRRIVVLSTLLLMGMLLLVQGFVLAQNSGRAPERRARPPVWDSEKTDGIFFDNVFEEGLIGPRPSNFGQESIDRTDRPPDEGGGPTGSVYAWSEIISSTTLEDYVKNMKLQVDENITSPGRFAGQGYKVSRRQFSLLAMLFAVVGEYDGEVRWQEYAPTARDQCARVAANSKVGTVQVFNEARQRKDDLQTLVGGGAIPLRPQSESAASWENVCDRSPLMQWLDKIHNQKILPWTGSEGEFSSHQEELLREAEIMAMMATILGKEGMEDASDDDYAAFCETMKTAALDIVAAVQLGNQQQAQAAAGVITTSCSDCHDFYRE